MPLIPNLSVFRSKLAGFPIATYQAGETVVTAGSTTGQLLILRKGVVAVLKEGVEIATVTEGANRAEGPGSGRPAAQCDRETSRADGRTAGRQGCQSCVCPLSLHPVRPRRIKQLRHQLAEPVQMRRTRRAFRSYFARSSAAISLAKA